MIHSNGKANFRSDVAFGDFSKNRGEVHIGNLLLTAAIWKEQKVNST